MEFEASPFFLGFVVVLLVPGLCWFVCNCFVSYCWFVVFFSLVGATSWFGLEVVLVSEDVVLMGLGVGLLVC